jgi:hypothetical protein
MCLRCVKTVIKWTASPSLKLNLSSMRRLNGHAHMVVQKATNGMLTTESEQRLILKNFYKEKEEY